MLYKIALVDDNPEILIQLAKELSHFDVVDIIFTAANGVDYLQKIKNLPSEMYPQVVIMDIEMPALGGIEAVKASSAIYANVKYIMFTVSDDDDKLFEAIKAGADGYLLKEEAPETIINAIREVIEQTGAPMSPSIARKTLKLLSRQPGKEKSVEIPATAILSDREVEILKSMVAGLNYKQIADKISLSPFTVRNHITKIYSKLHITSKSQAVQIAVSNRWV